MTGRSDGFVGVKSVQLSPLGMHETGPAVVLYETQGKNFQRVLTGKHQ
jgi:hypothetical protein